MLQHCNQASRFKSYLMVQLPSQCKQKRTGPLIGRLVQLVALRSCMKCCAKRLHGAIVACNVAEVELASTLAALRAILRATISEVDTRFNWHFARSIARKVASRVRIFILLLAGRRGKECSGGSTPKWLNGFMAARRSMFFTCPGPWLGSSNRCWWLVKLGSVFAWADRLLPSGIVKFRADLT